jgi:putative transposase
MSEGRADHCWLNIWLINDKGKLTRPYLTVIEDEKSRAIACYWLSWSARSRDPNEGQRVFRKEDARWHVCGIPERLYTDHGSDFTSMGVSGVARGRG